MSIKLMTQAWERRVSGSELILLLAIADFANDEGTRIFPSLARLAWKTGMGVSTVKRQISKFRKLGVLIVVRRGGGRALTTEYALNLARLAEKKPFDPAAGRAQLQALRAAIILRDGCRCSLCDRPGDDVLAPDDRPWYLDPVIPLKDGGAETDTNLRLACRTCAIARDRQGPQFKLPFRT